MDGRLVLPMTISDESAKQVHQEVAMAAMTTVLDLRDVLELIDDRLNDESPAQEHLVPQEHKPVLHVGSESRDQMNAMIPQFLEAFLADIPFVAKQLAEKAFGQGKKGRPVIGIAGSQLEGQYLPQIIDGEMQLETKEPAHGRLAPLGQAGEHFMTTNTPIEADSKRCGIDESNAGALSSQAFEIGTEGNQRGRNPLDETIIAGQSRKFPTPVIEHRQVEVLEVPIIGHMKQNQHGHDLAQRHRTGTLSDRRSGGKQSLDPKRFESPAEIIHVAKQLRDKVQCHWGDLLG